MEPGPGICYRFGMVRRRLDESGDGLEKDTLGSDTPWERQRIRRLAALTIAWHPDPDRVGGRCFLVPTVGGDPVAVWRGAPLFLDPGGAMADPLLGRRISRSPLLLSIDEAFNVSLDVRETQMRVDVDGATISGTVSVEADRLERGVVIELAGRVVLVLHRADWTLERPPNEGFIGESDAIVQSRLDLRGLAEHAAPVLIVGETGTGKHHFARTVHDLSARCAGPFVGAHLPPPPGISPAAAVFGAAGSGGSAPTDGWIQQASGGTLFIEDIDAAPPDLQLMLQQTIETGRVHRVGSASAEPHDIRLIATAARQSLLFDRLRPGLLYRLSRFEVHLPPLRARREDIGRLFTHFLREELAESGHASRLEPVGSREHPWLSAPIMSLLLAYSWPGNVLQLRNVAAQLALTCRALDFVPRRRVAELLLAEGPLEGAPADAADSRRPPRELSKEELVRAMEENGWNYTQTAKTFGIARNSLYALLRRHGLRLPGDLDPAVIRRALAASDGDIEAAARRLQVSSSGLRLRMTELGISWQG